ncbi:unnamed protein product [Acanthoscelides obtectus]|uniref:Ig-like domain-containing protein n=1 Tax=Acanthoscelides obtectus TaxID=200917 RepID=A0A9P0P4U2_ACAOB|nr:unnamed protein product [Acanthoscelides obtectus]CAK1643745.1 hypothetical protein AOBTE_LOCUS13658 [Acanthoscelides obtectus]
MSLIPHPSTMKEIPIFIIILTFSIPVSPGDQIICRDSNRPIATDAEDFYKLVDAAPGDNLVLQCHYCDLNPPTEPKNWFKSSRPGWDTPREVRLSMDNDMELNRMTVNTEHSLIIKNVDETDGGLYFCWNLGDVNGNDRFNYLVDVVFEETQSVEAGNISAWLTYHDQNYLPINKLFTQSNSDEFVRLRDIVSVDLELITQWDPWGPCDVCGRPDNHGVKKKRGRCRIKVTVKGGEPVRNAEDAYLQNVTILSCRSRKLYKLFPGVSNLTRVVPDFVQDEACEGVCNPDAEGVNHGWKVGKSKAFKYRKTFVIPEGSHLAMVCPESTLESTVIWRKKGRVLKPGDSSNPNVIVDRFSTLYLAEVTKEEEGNYTCQVDDIKMQQVKVFVVTKSKLLTNEMSRHMGYLGFVLLLYLTCYCGGLVITWSRRHTFKTYEELAEEHKDQIELDNLL